MIVSVDDALGDALSAVLSQQSHDQTSETAMPAVRPGSNDPVHHYTNAMLSQQSHDQIRSVRKQCLQVEQEADFGEGLESVDLEAEGANTPVTDDNKQRYVKLYVRHLLETSVQRQIDAFQRGFKRVCPKLLCPQAASKITVLDIQTNIQH